MKLLFILFLFLGYGLFTTMYNIGEATNPPDLPSFSPPGINFQSLPNNCSGFSDCIEYVGNILVNIVLGLIYTVLLVVSIMILFVEILGLISRNAFTGIDGAPPWLNLMLIGCLITALGVMIFRMVRKGDSEA